MGGLGKSVGAVGFGVVSVRYVVAVQTLALLARHVPNTDLTWQLACGSMGPWNIGGCGLGLATFLIKVENYRQSALLWSYWEATVKLMGFGFMTALFLCGQCGVASFN